VYEEGEVKVYRVGDPLPRAWVVYDVQIASDEDALALLNSEDFYPLQRAVLNVAPLSTNFPQEGGPADPAQVIESRPGRLLLDVTPSSDGLLMISQPFYPGWRATVDGELVPIYRADYLLQAIQLRAGSHRVELTYRLPLLPAIVSLIALAACVVCIFVRKKPA